MENKANKQFRILSIETSCDETSASILEAKFKNKNLKIKIISNIVSSQIKLHAKFGGVYPELASREHVKNILPVIEKAQNVKYELRSMNYGKNNSSFIIHDSIDAIAITTGPGLIGSLLVGVETAKTLSYVFDKPIIPVHHVEGHIYANFISHPESANSERRIFCLPDEILPPPRRAQNDKQLMPKFPILALVVSGGHTSLVYMKNHLQYKVIGETLDDAAGEAFDKVSAMLDLGYPGGPAVSALAEKIVIASIAKQSCSHKIAASSRHSGTPCNNIHFPRPMLSSNDYNFSFSGLKTSVLYTIKKLSQPLSQNIKAQICKEFQDAVVETLVTKTIRAAKKYKVKSILLCGGVASNSCLRQKFQEVLRCHSERSEESQDHNLDSSAMPQNDTRIRFFVPTKNLCTDNAAMIGAAAAYKIILGKKFPKWYDIKADSNLKL